MVDRRRFLQTTVSGGACLTAPRLLAATREARPEPPFRTLYSNDTTNILSCRTPWRNPKDGLTDEHLQHSIEEAAGVDVHMLQPGLGWIPWWNSEIYSPQDHYVRFLQEEHGIRGMRHVGRYLLEGGDMLQTLVDTCKRNQVAPFLSYRLNDGHHVRSLAEALNNGRPTPEMARHYWENYESYRIGKDLVNWDDGVFDWAIPEVRDYKFALIEEACARYDLAGLELDFLRHWVRFSDDTSLEQRQEITTAFVKRIRAMLDRTAKERGLPYRWLCIRVPARAEVRGEQGIDLAALREAGVDMANLSYSYFTLQYDSVLQAKKEAPDLPVYVEMTHTTLTGKAMSGSGTQPYLRTTDEQFYTTAHLAYEQGAQGVSLFNFQYYRYHKMEELGPFTEPPFHVLPHLKDREFLAKQPQWYFLTSTRNDQILGEKQLPVNITRREPHTFQMEMAPTARHTMDGLFRLRSSELIDDRKLEIRINGVLLEPTAHVAKPIDHPYDAWLGDPKEIQCFTVPRSALKQGANEVEVAVLEGIRVKVEALDITLPL